MTAGDSCSGERICLFVSFVSYYRAPLPFVFFSLLFSSPKYLLYESKVLEDGESRKKEGSEEGRTER